MNVHEYQAKQLFSHYGIPVPAGQPARSVDEAVSVARALGGQRWVVKAQVHAGGRGKAGGVVVAQDAQALQAAADKLLGVQLATAQTDSRGLPVNVVLVEQATAVAQEFYLAALVDRTQERLVIMASSAGGMDIEDVAQHAPEKILRIAVDPAVGLQAYQARKLAFGLGLTTTHLKSFSQILSGLYRLFCEKDASLVEINPLVLTQEGDLLALDAKINVDDNALYRQTDLAEWRDPTQEDDKEHQAAQHNLNYVSLDGDIGCMVNGAGLAMATMDLIKLHGGAPANFLDVGGGTTVERVAEAVKLILSDTKVRAILVNIFGGIVRCDLIASGIVQAVRQVQTQVPVVVRLQGTNVDQGRQILAESGLAITPVADLTEAAERVVAASRAGGAP